MMPKHQVAADLDPIEAGVCISRLAGLFGISHRALAEEIGISKVALSNIVTGKARAKDSTYLRLFGVFGLRGVPSSTGAAIRSVARDYECVEQRCATIRRRRQT